MTPAELLQRIRLGEDSALELKQVRLTDAGKVKAPHADSLSDELAALGNAGGGMLVLGVDDKSRVVTGIPLQHLDRVEDWLTALCTDRIKPPLDVLTRHLELPDATGAARPVILVEVPRSLWVHQSANGYFRRLGHAKRELAPDALARLFQQRSQARLIRFEEQEVPGCGFDDFDALLLRRFLKVEQGDPIAQLSRLHLLREVAGEPRPTVAGVLLCTTEPARWLRNAEIIAVAHTGTENDPNAQIDARDIGGPLDRQILDAFHFVQRNMRTAARKPLGRIDYPQYAVAALFEAIVNAVAHRDYSLHGQRIRLFMYSDRLEIHSPGALPNTLSLESMTRLSVPRNEVLTSLFGRYYPVEDPRLGKSFLMDRRGFGVETILRESTQLSGICPLYEQIDDLELCLTLYAAAMPTALAEGRV
ncbi:ATP-binding protein [Halochromatium roseum]|uniref:ATP-binding protein n=1 Tax=Halochromatium roseum TaxID=391920 RepID=UPI001913A23F|nr:ATP-binding protein [Halochromatium roseum]MBK5941760.1 transcriptional regulator [Halochromatium roseum]